MPDYENYVFLRSLAWRLHLDDWEESQINRLNSDLESAMKQVIRKFRKTAIVSTDGVKWSASDPLAEKRLRDLLTFLSGLTTPVQKALEGQAGAIYDQVATKTTEEYNDILSIEGSLRINTVTPTQRQITAMVATVAGGTFATAFDYHLHDRVISALDTGILTGVGYRPLVDTVSGLWKDGLRNDIISLVRTHVQSVQNKAAKLVADHNRDILRNKWEWCAILDNRACISCMCLDGRLFDMDDDIDIPLHIRCRCIRKWRTKSWAEITKGKIDIPEAEKKMRVWAWRKDGAIGVGGKKLLLHGNIKGSFKDFYKKLPYSSQKKLVGPVRARLIREGKISFDDMVTPRGEIYALSKDREGLSHRTYKH